MSAKYARINQIHFDKLEYFADLIPHFAMTEWYRRKSWTKKDEEEFFEKLGRARKYNRAQYLRVQAIELIETESENLLSVAELLLNKILTEHADARLERSPAFNSLGEIYKLRKDYHKALEYFKRSLVFEREFPNVITDAYLNYSETVVQAGRTDLYDEVEALLEEEIGKDSFRFPVQNYIIFSVLSVISEFKGDFKKAKVFSEIAARNSDARTNTLWNPRKKTWGTVTERIGWLDKLLRKE